MSKSRLATFLSLILVFVLGLIGMIPSNYAQDTCTFSSEQIRMGDTVTGRVSNNSPVFEYCFNGEAGQEVVIDLKRISGSLDPFLELTNIDGDEVYATNDDRSLSTTDAQIIIELPETSAYVIHATRYDRENGSTQGTFELKLSTDDTSSRPTPRAERADGCPVLYQPISYGETFDGTIDDENYFYSFCFVGSGGEEVVIDAIAADDSLDTLLLLTDLRIEDVLAENDDVRLGNRDSRIVFTLPETGPYLLTVSRYDLEDGTTEGDFTLTIKVNDGTFSEEDLFDGNYEPAPYECNRPLIRQLNATQWLEADLDYDFRLNFGCEGQAAISILGKTFLTSYTFDGNDLQIMLNDQEFAVTLESDGTLSLMSDSNVAFTFTDAGECSSQIEQDLQEGVWFLDENTSLFRLDFLCNNLVIVTLDAESDVYTYDYNTATDTMNIGANALVWTEVFILPGSYMSVETEDEPFIFTNILTEIEGSDEADI